MLSSLSLIHIKLYTYLVRALLDLSLGGGGSTVSKAKARVTWKVIRVQVHLYN